ncbi:DMT family transporter [Sinorhizobium sp. BG8]|uniref:DMT family transporter n=1 Tax=Sinorhizobium sp. BG8 TaxID=2613773 RepID=UPI00193E1581|nr:DMT family transporter [Sinorhizobium sp. BG8]QRM54113.1 DMT family transporter [Sinorhizobium sp. BG8]
MNDRKNGYVYTLLAITIFAIQDGISKHLGGAYPPVFISMIRFWAFAAFVVVMATRSKGGLRAAVRTKRPVIQILRGVGLAVQIVIVITSFSTVGLAHSQAILSAGPLFVALLSMPLLGERVGWRRWTAIAVGFAGVLLILKPERGSFEPSLLLPLSGAAMFALYVIGTRLANRDDSSTTSFFYTGVAGAVAITFVGPFYWTQLAPVDWIWMLALCMTGIASHYCLIRAYDLLDAASVQPLTYLQLVMSAIIAVVIFGETLNLNMIAGSVIVVGAGIFTIWRESVVARRNREQT